MSCLRISGGGGKGNPYKIGTFFRPYVYERVGVSLVEVHESIVKSVIAVSEKP